MMKAFPIWLRVCSWTIVCLAALATGIALWLTVLDWSGRRAWAAALAKLETNGDSLDFAVYAPTPIPDDENFFKTPFLATVLIDDEGKAWDAFRYRKDIQLQLERWPVELLLSWERGRAIDFAGLGARNFFQREAKESPAGTPPAALLLRNLERLRPTLDELVTAARTRQGSRVDFGARHIPYPARPDAWAPRSRINEVVVGVVESLALRACAELALKQSDAAFDDVIAILRLAQGVLAHPDVAMATLGGGVISLGMQPIWEASARGAWSDDQWRVLQENLGRLEPLRALATGIRAGRGDELAYMEKQQQHRSAWWRTEGAELGAKANYLVSVQRDKLDTFDPATRRIDVARIATFNPVISNAVVVRAGAAETRVALIDMAAALERHRLRHGAYPEELAALDRALISRLPHDVIDGKPLRYSRTAGGKFSLYSIGANGTDEHGTPPKQENWVGGNDWSDRSAGDWVWLPPKTE